MVTTTPFTQDSSSDSDSSITTSENHILLFVSQEPTGNVVYSFEVETGKIERLSENVSGHWLIGDRLGGGTGMVGDPSGRTDAERSEERRERV